MEDIEFISIIDFKKYMVEAITLPSNMEEVTLWISNHDSDIKVRIGQFGSDIIGKLTSLMIAEEVNDNQEIQELQRLFDKALSEKEIEVENEGRVI